MIDKTFEIVSKVSRDIIFTNMVKKRSSLWSCEYYYIQVHLHIYTTLVPGYTENIAFGFPR